MHLAALQLNPDDRAHLELVANSHNRSQRASQRAQIVLLAANGWSNLDIAAIVGLHHNQVGRWRQRFLAYGMDGLVDHQRTGRPPVFDGNDVRLMLQLLANKPPEGAQRWTMTLLADAMGMHDHPISASQAWRICRSLNLVPSNDKSWMSNHASPFWARASDVCGLYIAPSERCIVFSIDERSGMRPKLPSDTVRRRTGYTRRGIAVLLATIKACNSLDEALTHTASEMSVIEFLGDLLAKTPWYFDLHCISEILAAPATPRLPSFLKANPRIHLHHVDSTDNWLGQVERFLSILESRLRRRNEIGADDRLLEHVTELTRRSALGERLVWVYDGKPRNPST